MMLKVSSDGGATWGPDRFICTCSGIGSQADPIIEVVPNTGAVYAVFMNGYNVMFTKSTDHGATWSTPVKTYGKVSWNDKPILAVSDNGNDVYVSWNGPHERRPLRGAVSQRRFHVDADQGRQLHALLLRVRRRRAAQRHGRVLRDQPGLRRSGRVARRAGAGERAPLDQQRRVVHREPGRHGRARRPTARRPDARPTTTPGTARSRPTRPAPSCCCTTARPSPRATRRSGPAAPPMAARPGRHAQALSTAGEMADFPAAEARGAGDVRAYYMQTNGGNFDAWNVWYRASTDGGVTWAAPVKISDVTAGASYKTANGFLEPYGDYGEAAITNTRQVHRHLGRGQLLHRPRRSVVQPADIAPDHLWRGGRGGPKGRPFLVPAGGRAITAKGVFGADLVRRTRGTHPASTARRRRRGRWAGPGRAGASGSRDRSRP